MLPLTSRFSAVPEAKDLYRPDNEKDACGVACVATMRGHAGHDIVALGLEALINLDHRGAVGAEEDTGDGAGITTQLPDRFLRARFGDVLPAVGSYAAGLAFLPQDADERAATVEAIQTLADDEGLVVLGWRDVPVVDGLVGPSAAATQPWFAQLAVALRDASDAVGLERRAFALRRRAEHATGAYFPSLSSRTITYKGMLTPHQLRDFFPDLTDERFESEIALVHSRFSTNTFPAWPLAQPFRVLAHNGEINTVRGNRNRMRGSEASLVTDAFGDDFARLLPVCTPGASDSATLDEVLELLTMAGRSLPHALMMLIPQPWERDEDMDPRLRDFYRYHAMLQEAWDGPAAIITTDGSQVVATLDRNGLRPSRYWVTDDQLVVIGSEAGVLPLDPSTIIAKGRVEPGSLFSVDVRAGRIVPDAEAKARVVSLHPWGDWADRHQLPLRDLPAREPVRHTSASVVRRQQTFGYTEEELRILLAPMAAKGAEPIGAMGSDTPIAALSDRPRLLFDYFKQMFAQVTNPPLDAIREEMVTALGVRMGRAENVLHEGEPRVRQILLDSPIIDNGQMAKVAALGRTETTRDLRSVVLRGLYPVADGAAGLRARLDELCDEAVRAVDDGAAVLILSDRDSNQFLAPIPSLLLVSAVAHHLVREGRRTRAALVAETGDVREVHHAAVLIGYGASAVNPYLAIETVEDLAARSVINGVTAETAVAQLVKGLAKGVLKIMSKMGISTVASYRGAQTFEAVGLSRELVEQYFTGTVTRLGGIGLESIADGVAARHALAYPRDGFRPAHRRLEIGGEYQWRREGPKHSLNPDSVFWLQQSTKRENYEEFRRYSDLVDDQSRGLLTLRGLLDFAPAEPIDIDEVEPVSAIVKRFMTGAMSYGSISLEAHETLAIAMNRIGGMSNSGEGGEEPERLYDPERSSAIKQIASGRFGVTSEYLVHARDLQIKIAQGAKPGEGGQLPPQKVYPWIARTRKSTPGIGLISPPPHHDIYSIEDIKQLIHDLKCANPSARISVKLVAEDGVGTVAAGVVKAKADVVLVSGHDGGTGASPLNSLKHAGTPWELGLAEVQQTLMANGLRDRVTVQVDGQLKTGRDVVVAALLGAEEFGFATAPLVATGCVMMRVCHLDTCPVGVATQNPELRARFTGTPEVVVTFMEFIAQQVREHLASLGLRSIDEAVGRADLLVPVDPSLHPEQAGLDLAPLLAFDERSPAETRRCSTKQEHGLEGTLGDRLARLAAEAIDRGNPVRIDERITNVDRTVGTLLGHRLTLRHGGDGLPDGTIDVHLTGSAGQSLGAFLPRGASITVHGDANDYVAKGLSGGRVVVTPPEGSRFVARDQVIAGNTVAYGATSGTLYLAGRAGERFGVRNSGATLVVEGIGDHGCEYMTGGAVFVLGPTGRNLCAGMSGGSAFVLDLDREKLNASAASDGSLLIRAITEEHRPFVLEVLADYAEATGSAQARELLADPDMLFLRLSEIVPTEFERVMTIRQSALDRDIDPDSNEVWNEILEGSHG